MAPTTIPNQQTLEMEVVPLTIANEGIRRSIEEGYAGGAPNQWALELWRNFHQAVGRAGGTLTHTPVQRFDMLGVHRGALKRVVWNTGPHMTETELRSYMLTLGQGSGDTWSLDNPQGDRHAGARETLLPWNPAGVIVLSYHPRLLPHGAMVWLKKDAHGNFGAAMLPSGAETALGDPEYDKVVALGVDPYGFDWMTLVDATASGRGVAGGIKRQGGVAFALLGQDTFVDDLDGVDNSAYARSRGRVETPTALTNYLLDKVATTGSTTVSVVYPVGEYTGNRLLRVDSAGGEHGYDSRNIYGLDGWTTKGLAGGARRAAIPARSGVVPLTLSGVEVGNVEWTMLDADPGRTAFAPYQGLGHVAARYRDELMFRPNRGSAPKQLSHWGIIIPEVANRVRLIVNLDQIGPGWHIIQDPARADIRAADGSGIPWETFQDQFNDQMEELAAPIWDEMARIRAERPRNLEAERRLLDKLRRKLSRPNRDPESVDTSDARRGDPDVTAGVGDEIDAGIGGYGNGDPNPHQPLRNPRPGAANDTEPVHEADGPGDTPVRTRPRRPGLPIPEWVHGDAWVDAHDYDPSRFVVVVRSGSDVIIRYNEDHEVYTTQVAWFTQWCAEHRNRRLRRLPAAEVIESVKEAYHLDSAPRYLWGMRSNRSFRDVLDKAETDPQLCVMTIGAGGFNNVDQAIATDLAQRASATRPTGDGLTEEVA
jgi:hypothetical protein